MFLPQISRVCILATCAWLVSACGTLSGDVGLSVVGVNYTESEYSMIVRDANDQTNSGVTGELTPYSAGGQMCCFSLPSKWRPDLALCRFEWNLTSAHMPRNAIVAA